MRIKKLEIIGFKSFAQRAHLQFGAGITGVVGPNGCGKSNIVDAIRWCMGEMSAKHLRGKAMQDIIFAGSDSYGPQGMAEVTLTFDNDPDGQTPSGYLSYAEIAVTRRLFRDGTSEYLINKTPVRLRDITDLFLGTGVGTRAYSIIEQGRISFVVNARPEDRRTLIEEVAGITKYKARKKAAERRMEFTEQNLQRVNDVVAELARQLESLQRQAKRAEKYRNLRATQRDLEQHLAALDALRIMATSSVHQKSLNQEMQSLSAAQRSLLADETALECERAELSKVEAGLLIQQENVAEHEARLAVLRRDLEHWQRQSLQAEERALQGTREAEQGALRLQQMTLQEAAAQSVIADLGQQAQQDQDSLVGLQTSVQTLQDHLAAVDQELEVLRRNAMAHIQGATRQRTLATSLEKRGLEMVGKSAAAFAEQEELRERAAQAQGRSHDLGVRHEELRSLLAVLKSRLHHCRQQMPPLQKRLVDSGQTLRAATENVRQKRSRLASLQEIATRLDGYSDGVRTLLSPRKEAEKLAGLVGLVTEILQVPPTYERAVEAVLGDALQYLLVRETATAKSAVAQLKEHTGGRSGFIPVAPSPRVVAAPLTAPTAPGIVGQACQLVQCAPEYRDVMTCLLGHVLVVETLADALQVHALALPWTCVSLEGDVVDAVGVISGGSPNGAGLLANRREIRELHELLRVRESELQDVQRAHDALENERLKLESANSELSREVHATELSEVNLAKDAQAARAELNRAQQRLQLLERETLLWQEQAAQLKDEANAAAAAAVAAEEGHQQTEGHLSGLQAQRHGEALALKEHADELTGLKVQIAARQERLAAERQMLQRSKQSRDELQNRMATAHQAVAAGAEQASQLLAQVREGRDVEQTQQQEVEELAATLGAARAAYQERLTSLGAQERCLKEQRQGGEALHESIVVHKMELQRLALEQQTLAEHVLQRHDKVLGEVVHAYHLQPPIDASAQKQVADLERTIRNLGPINLTAIEECAQVQARFTFLVHQRDDLKGALEALRQAIGRINRASRERFREAFEAVNDMFQKVYPRLFRGGTARLELTESTDLLEAGVDIIAMPPGKKLQNVGLLSGGEKALTATALVFSIFLIKPSPFCILDEVDAPLDEANVGRFNEMLREIAKVSQFIVITHNKQTMLKTDRLYGITMEEPGMSKVVSVDLRRAGKEQAA